MRFKSCLVLLTIWLVTAMMPAQAIVVERSQMSPGTETFFEFRNLSQSFHDLRSRNRIRIGVSLMQRHDKNPYFKAIYDGLMMCASSVGAEIIVAESDSSVNEQLRDLEELLGLGLDILIVSPVDGNSVRQEILRAHQEGVVVVAIDSRSRGPVDTYVGSDNIEAGIMAAEEMARILGQTGRIAIVSAQSTVSVQERVSGFTQGIANHPNIRVVELFTAPLTRGKCEAAVAGLLKRQPDLDGIFVVSDPQALGVRDALIRAGMPTKIVSVDGNPDVIRLLIKKDPNIVATIGQFPEHIAKSAVGFGLIRHWGGVIPNDIKIKLQLVTSRNATMFSW